MPVCDGVSDWPLQTCNIILNVSAASIGYTGPALHQAVALDGNIININKGNLKTNEPFSDVFQRCISPLIFLIYLVETDGKCDRFSLVRGKCLIGSIWEVRRLTIGYYKVVGLRVINKEAWQGWCLLI